MNNLNTITQVTLFSLVTTLSFALTTAEKAEMIKNNEKELRKLGIELVKGLNIVNAKTALAHNKEVSRYLAMHEEQEKNGFVKQSTPRAEELLNFKKTSAYQYKKYQNNLSPHSTHLRHHLSELKMAYTFVGVPESEMDVNIGVSPYGAYKQVKYGDESDGWDGAVQFFENQKIGACEFSEHNRKLAGGGVELIKELVSYEIADKPTVVLVNGERNSSFLYTVTWYDNLFTRELSCAAKTYSSETKNNVIELARKIEAFQ